jgi:hypothetical protein
MPRIHIPTARKAGALSYRYDDWPEGTVYIGRRFTMGGYDLPDTLWGNPYKVRQHGRGRSVALYRRNLSPEVRGRIEELRGKTLACWCKQDELCHGDVLLDLLGEGEQ